MRGRMTFPRLKAACSKRGLLFFSRYFFLLGSGMRSTTVLLGRRRASSTDMSRPVIALRPIRNDSFFWAFDIGGCPFLVNAAKLPQISCDSLNRFVPYLRTRICAVFRTMRLSAWNLFRTILAISS